MACACVDTTSGESGGGGGTPSTVTRQGAIIPTIVAVTATGSTDDLVLHFVGASVQIGALAVASWLTRTDSATLGTTLQPTQPGLYHVQLYVPWAAAGQSVASMVTFNATLAQRQTAFAEPNAPECYGIDFDTAPNIQGNTVDALIPVTAADIAQGTNVIRCQTGDALAPGTPLPAAAYINPTSTCCRIFRVGDVAP